MGKYITISIEHPDITMLRVEVNKKIIKTKHRLNANFFKAYHGDSVEIFFEPWKIQPLIRFNYALVNYGLAGINQWDHKVDFVVDLDFSDVYFKNIIDNKRRLIRETDKDILNIDAYIGIDSYHWDIIEEIEKKIASTPSKPS